MLKVTHITIDFALGIVNDVDLIFHNYAYSKYTLHLSKSLHVKLLRVPNPVYIIIFARAFNLAQADARKI